VAIVDRLGKALSGAPILLSSVDALMDWSRGQSLWAMPLGTACCAMELIAASFSKFDFDRLGTFPRPRHTDVMIVAGTITRKMAPAVTRLYEQMAEPKYVVAMGNCAVSGGIFFYDSYSVVRTSARS
jgi:NADH-quinone oxidoreductase subunit B